MVVDLDPRTVFAVSFRERFCERAVAVAEAQRDLATGETRQAWIDILEVLSALDG